MAQSPSQSDTFRRVYDSYSASMREYCFRRLPASDANDAVAEVFVIVWRRIDALPPEGELKLWLYGIARNIVRNSHRSARRRERLGSKLLGLGSPPEPAPEVVVVRHHEHEALLAALATLRPEDQEILRLKTWEELSSAEIAEVMGLTIRAVDTRLSRARQKLAHRVERSRSTPKATVRPSPVEQGGER